MVEVTDAQSIDYQVFRGYMFGKSGKHGKIWFSLYAKCLLSLFKHFYQLISVFFCVLCLSQTLNGAMSVTDIGFVCVIWKTHVGTLIFSPDILGKGPTYGKTCRGL